MMSKLRGIVLNDLLWAACIGRHAQRFYSDLMRLDHTASRESVEGLSNRQPVIYRELEIVKLL